MCLCRIPLQILRALVIVALLGGPATAQGNPAAMTWYDGGEAKLRLTPVPAETPADILLAGKTRQKELLVTVTKEGGETRRNNIPLTADGAFNVRYLIKDGPGSYTITFFGNMQKGSTEYQGLGFFTLMVTESLPAQRRDPELNGQIMQFVNQVLGSKVGRGECWDLAQAALDENLADWSRPFTFGLPLDPESAEIKAGDIVQFRSLKITERLSDRVTRRESLGSPDHTAVIYKVLGKKHYTLAHQNVSGKRRVITSNINLANVTGGRYWIYRPVALMLRQ